MAKTDNTTMPPVMIWLVRWMRIGGQSLKSKVESLKAKGQSLSACVIQGVSNGGEAVDAPELAIHALAAEPVTHGGASFNRLKTQAASGEFFREHAERVGALQIHARRGGKIQD